MNAHDAASKRRFYRDADRALLGGVCAGIAGYLGFNLRATRFLAFVAILMTMPVGLIAYIAAVFMVPSSSCGNSRFVAGGRGQWKCRARRKEFDEAELYEASEEPGTAELLRNRCKALDERLVSLEKHVTSKRFQLEQELQRL